MQKLKMSSTSTSGQTKKPVHWPPMATKSMSTLNIDKIRIYSKSLVF